jgi:hypothetical protein
LVVRLEKTVLSEKMIEEEVHQAITSSTAAVEASWVEGEIISEPGAPSHI